MKEFLRKALSPFILKKMPILCFILLLVILNEFSIRIIKSVRDYNIRHLYSTGRGSSGAPIMNL